MDAFNSDDERTGEEEMYYCCPVAPPHGFHARRKMGFATRVTPNKNLNNNWETPARHTYGSRPPSDVVMDNSYNGITRCFHKTQPQFEETLSGNFEKRPRFSCNSNAYCQVPLGNTLETFSRCSHESSPRSDRALDNAYPRLPRCSRKSSPPDSVMGDDGGGFLERPYESRQPCGLFVGGAHSREKDDDFTMDWFNNWLQSFVTKLIRLASTAKKALQESLAETADRQVAPISEYHATTPLTNRQLPTPLHACLARAAIFADVLRSLGAHVTCRPLGQAGVCVFWHSTSGSGVTVIFPESDDRPREITAEMPDLCLSNPHLNRKTCCLLQMNVMCNEPDLLGVGPYPERLQRYSGTLGSRSFLGRGIYYWECRLSIRVRSGIQEVEVNRLLFEAAMARPDVKDSDVTLCSRPGVWGIQVFTCSRHEASLCVEGWSEENQVDHRIISTLPSRFHLDMTLGFVLDLDLGIWTVLNLTSGTPLCEQSGLTAPVLPTFGLYNSKFVETAVALVTKQDIDVDESKVSLVFARYRAVNF